MSCILQIALTAEEITAKRRAERQQFKLDRAQAFAASVAEAEAAFAAGNTSVKIAPLTREAVANFAARSATDYSESDGGPDPLRIDPVENVPSNSTEIDSTLEVAEDEVAPDEVIPENLEHLQLTLQEAFFLLWSLDCLRVLDTNSVRLTSFSLISMS